MNNSVAEEIGAKKTPHRAAEERKNKMLQISPDKIVDIKLECVKLSKTEASDARQIIKDAEILFTWIRNDPNEQP